MNNTQRDQVMLGTLQQAQRWLSAGEIASLTRQKRMVVAYALRRLINANIVAKSVRVQRSSSRVSETVTVYGLRGKPQGSIYPSWLAPPPPPIAVYMRTVVVGRCSMLAAELEDEEEVECEIQAGE